jgi:hypothetical protein
MMKTLQANDAFSTLCDPKPKLNGKGNHMVRPLSCLGWGDSGSGGQISWDRNSTFSGDQIFDHEVKIVFVHEVELVQ